MFSLVSIIIVVVLFVLIELLITERNKVGTAVARIRVRD